MQKRLKQLVAVALAVAGAALVPNPAQAAVLVAGWDFEKVEADGVTIKSVVGNAFGTINGSAIQTDATGGRPNGGVHGFDVSANNPGFLFVDTDPDTGDAQNVLTTAAADDAVSIVLWQKNNSNINASSFWARSEINDRWWNFHIPWSDGVIYFDTAGGCCASPGQRLSANVVNTFPDHDWLAWHHYAFVKDHGAKRVYIDGNLLVGQDDGADPLDITATAFHFTIGAADKASPPDAVIDDFAIYQGALTEDEIKLLAAGGSPFSPPKDTDGDGIPDYWETQYGFNPNDASDAHLDPDNDGCDNLCEYKAGTDPNDHTPPTLVSAATGASVNSVTLTFSESVEDTSATDKTHYSVTPGINITAATHPKPKIVILTTDPLTPNGTPYTVTINNVKDLSKNSIAPDTKALFFSPNITKDVAHAYPAYILGSAVFTPDAGGHTAKPGDRAINMTLAGGPLVATDTAFLAAANAATGSDELSVAFWQMKLDVADSSAFNLQSPSAANNRGFHAHVPWSDQHIYFDTVGCCDAATQRITAGIDTFPDYTGDATFWTASWHHFVFTKKLDQKNIWIDGQLFLNGSSSNPLLTDHTAFYMGGGEGGANMSHAIMDDFAMFGKELSESDAKALFAGTKPNALPAATGLIAWWDFNDFPANGSISGVIPAANAKSAQAHIVGITHTDGANVWDKTKAVLQIDGSPVAAQVDKTGTDTKLTYHPSPLFASDSAHTATLLYDGALVYQWSFKVVHYSGITHDKVAQYPGLLENFAVYTADKGGHTAAVGDYGVDLTKKGGPVLTTDSGFLAAVNAATANDELSVAFWQKKEDVADSCAFSISSPTAPYGRNFFAHVPWSDQHIYFDTVGCCDAATQRISAGIDTFPDYTGDATWWTDNWHLFVFTKKLDQKNIWIDGQLFLNGSSTSALLTDTDSFYMGSSSLTSEPPNHAVIDDFSVFGKELSEANVQALFAGTKPNALPAATGLIAWWDFNDANVAPPTPPKLSIANGPPGKVVITFEGTLVSSANAAGPYAPLAGASPLTLDATQATQFIRAVK